MLRVFCFHCFFDLLNSLVESGLIEVTTDNVRERGVDLDFFGRPQMFQLNVSKPQVVLIIDQGCSRHHRDIFKGLLLHAS